jgi:hypothetical protein
MRYYINRSVEKDMKNKLIIRGVYILILAAICVSLIISVTLSWYRGALETQQDFIIEADGVLYLYVPASIEKTNQVLYPAKAMPYAVSNGLHMDPLVEYDSQDPNPSYISQAATIAHHTSYFIFYNEYRRNVQATDEYGNPLYDEYGNPIYVPATDEYGNPLFDDEGNPIYLTEPTPAELSYNLALKKTSYIEIDDYIDIEELVIKEFYFSYNSEPIPPHLPINEENGALAYLEVTEDKTYGKVRVEGTVEVYIHMQIYIANVDELMDPALSDSNFYIEVQLAVMPEV